MHMRNCAFVCACLVAALVGFGVHPVSGQTFEGVGVRAQGMSGAFVAVANDATASWWNPAGLASGAYLSAVVERGQITEPASPPPEGPARRITSSDFAVAFPALGLSYYRLRISEIARPASTAEAPETRQDPRIAGSSVRSVAVSQFGSTVGQSIGEHLVVGTTLKLLHAGMVSSTAAGSDPLDDAGDLDVNQSFRADIDAGVMASLGLVRLGLTVRNLGEPDFGSGDERLTLERQARVGMAILSAPHGALQGFTAAVDADLTKTSTATGDVRHVAAGLEGWLAKGRLGLRAGASANTVGERRPAASVGASVALTRAFHVNVSRTAGRDDSVTGWSSSVSIAF
jgi:hypothetical protein